MLMYGLMLLSFMRDAGKKFLKNERGDVNVVAIVVLIAVAVVLALLLKNQLADLIRTIIDLVKGKATTALDDA